MSYMASTFELTSVSKLTTSLVVSRTARIITTMCTPTTTKCSTVKFSGAR